MTYEIAIVLSDRNYAVSERISHDGNETAAWTALDVEQVLKAMLLAIDRQKNPASGQRHIALRGFSWIAEPTADGVVIAVEIPSGAAVAGPFEIAQPVLERLIQSVVSAADARPPVVH